MISYGAIIHEIELGKSVLEEHKQIIKKIFSFADILRKSDIRKVLSVIELDKLDEFGQICDRGKIIYPLLHMF